MSVWHNPYEVNFLPVPKELISDTRISVAARFVYVYLSSLPDRHHITNKDVMETIGIKSASVMAKYWKELINAGWVKREKVTPDSLNRCGYYEYELMISIED